MRIHPMAAALLLSLTAIFATAADPAETGYSAAIKVSPLLRTTETLAGQPIVYPRTDKPEVSAVLVEIPPGAETGWHRHPYPCYAYILSGSLTVDLENGKTSKLSSGEALAESVNLMHNGRNTGTEPVKLVMFVTGEEGLPFTIRKPVSP